jgi:hypothetical protein
MAGAAAGIPTVVRVLDVIKIDVDEVDLRLGITVDGDFVVVVREVVQCVRGVKKHALIKPWRATQAKILRVCLASLAASSILHVGLGRSTLRPRVRCGISPRCWTGRWWVDGCLDGS